MEDKKEIERLRLGIRKWKYHCVALLCVANLCDQWLTENEKERTN